MTRKTFDPRCLELATAFLADFDHTKADANELAWAIQDVIENYTNGLEPKPNSKTA